MMYPLLNPCPDYLSWEKPAWWWTRFKEPPESAVAPSRNERLRPHDVLRTTRALPHLARPASRPLRSAPLSSFPSFTLVANR